MCEVNLLCSNNGDRVVVYAMLIWPNWVWCMLSFSVIGFAFAWFMTNEEVAPNYHSTSRRRVVTAQHAQTD